MYIFVRVDSVDRSVFKGNRRLAFYAYNLRDQISKYVSLARKKPRRVN